MTDSPVCSIKHLETSAWACPMPRLVAGLTSEGSERVPGGQVLPMSSCPLAKICSVAKCLRCDC